MHRSSESVAALASALAKAQGALVNPEKSLTATIRSGRTGEADRSFRYAPLSSGLDMVRKTLGQHEIATIQATAIDQTTRMVNLTTVLAHASGEWIASDWPVCPLAEITAPQRMGAALTYARRYALFTLVGIAGEDDLDAPDLCEGTGILPAAASTDSSAMSMSAPSGAALGARRHSENWKPHGLSKHNDSRTLNAEQSAVIRDKLTTELANITSAAIAADWAREALVAKNALTADDAKLVESAFEQRMSDIAATDVSESKADDLFALLVSTCTTEPDSGNAEADGATSIDKSVLTVATPRRYRNRDHLRHVARQACLVCARTPSDAHHLRFLQPRALGRKASDEFTVPLCRGHHRAVHRAGNEVAWWKAAGIDPIKAARRLWRQTRRNEGRETSDPTPPQAAIARAQKGEAAESSRT